MSTQSFPLGGGIDMVTPSIAIKPGVARAARNYESLASGYGRIAGFERFDGRAKPSQGSDESDIAARRAAILEVPGSGPIRGVLAYKGEVYAWRDDAGATACIMHKATAGGWSAVALSRALAFTSGGTTEIQEGDTITGATSGATAVVRRVVVRTGSWAAGTAEGTLAIDSQTGTFAAEDLNVGATLNVATIAADSAAFAFPAAGRYDFELHNFYGDASGKRVYGANGVGPAFEFDGATLVSIPTGVPSPLDKPTRVGVQANHLLLGYAGGQVSVSSIGNPLVFDATTGAVTFAVGDEIADIISKVAGATIFLGHSSVNILYGKDADTFEIQALNETAGGRPWSAAMIDKPVYMDNVGVRSLATTNAFGNFNIGTLTRAIQPLLDSYKSAGVDPVGAVAVRLKTQYRVFMSNMDVISIYLGRKNPEPMVTTLTKAVSCVIAADTDAGAEEIYFGSDDGFVYQMDVGTSFDGDPILHFMRLPFNHVGGPMQRKRWFKALLEMEGAPNTTIRLSADLDYGDPAEVGIPEQLFDVSGGGGFWDVDFWDSFYWSNPAEGQAECYLNGVSRNISLLMAGNTDDEPPHLMSALTLFFEPRGLQR